MKILFLIPNLSHGGAEKVLVNLVNNMDHDKYNITVKTLFDVGINKKFLNKKIQYKHIFNFMPRGNTHLLKLLTPKQLYKLFIKETYDVIVSYLEGPTARIASGCDNEKTKLVSWIHIEQHTKKNASYAFRSYNEAKKCYESFHKTICVSKAVMEDFRSLFSGVKNISVLYNTIESDYIRAKAEEEIIDERFNNYKGIKLCGVGKINQNKGFMRLARIHNRLLKKGYAHKIYILGVGPDKQKIEKYLAENNISDSFIFLGYDENPYKYIASSDIFVCSSFKEGFSTAVTESIIVGTPVVTTLCAGMKELLGENNEYGIITKNSEEALEDGIENMLSDKILYNNYKEKTVERSKLFLTRNTVTAVENMLNELYNED